MNRKITLVLAAATACFAAGAAWSATETANFDVTITLSNACDVTTTPPTDMGFGSHGLLTSAITATSTITVTCTEGASYDIGLDDGLNGAGNTTARKMDDNGSNSVSYDLRQPDGSSHWGDIIGTDTVTSTGTGNAQSFTVNGVVPVQATPPAGSYADTIQVTVTF